MLHAKRLVLSGMIMLISLSVIFIHPAMADMLADEVSAALKTHPAIAAQNFGAAAAREQIGQAIAGYRPTLDARAAGGHQDTNNPATRARLNDHAELDVYELSLTMKQNVFGGFNTKYSVKSARAGFQAASLGVSAAAESVGLQAVQAYITVLRGQGLVRITERNLAIHKQLLDLVQQRVKQKVGSSAEVNQATARVKEAEAELYQAQGGLKNALTMYKTVVGTLPGKLEDPVIPSGEVSASLDALIEDAMKDNPAISRGQALLARAEAEVERRRSAYWPNLDLELTGYSDEDISGTPGRYEGYNAMAVLSYNLYAGGSTTRSVQETKLLLKQAKSDLEFARRNVTERVMTSHNNIRVSGLRLKTFEAQVKENERVRKAFAEQFRVGKRTLLDLLDSQKELFRSKSNAVTESYEEAFAVYTLLASQGRLLKTLGVSVPTN